MKTVLNMIRSAGNDLFDLIYPVCCLVCGVRLRDNSYICPYCLKYAFVPVDREGYESAPGIVLPDRLAMHEALWEFDKGGFLQDVLHHLKYSGLAGLGVTLGRELGQVLKKNRWMSVDQRTLLLPVPLHPARQRKRGYNQSVLIARGVADITEASMLDERTVTRIKKTRTQTGLSAQVRRNNISGAFHLNQSEPFTGNDVLIIDDVFTTGATTMELASLITGSAAKVGIATIARA